MYELHILTTGDPDTTVVDRYHDLPLALLGYAHLVRDTIDDLRATPGVDALVELVDADAGLSWERGCILAGPDGPDLVANIGDDAIRHGLHLDGPRT